MASSSLSFDYDVAIREVQTTSITIRDTADQITDPTSNDDNIYPQYEYRGYHRFTPEQYLQTGEGSPYSKTALDKGLVVARRHFQRLEMLLRTIGERVDFWRRKWQGQICPHFDDRRGRDKMRCLVCFGTGIVGGFELHANPFANEGYAPSPPEDGFINPKPPPDANKYNREYPYSRKASEEYPPWQIFIRIHPETDDKKLFNRGMQQDAQPQAWTLPMPMLQDRDLIIRYDEDSNETWRYEVLNVTRNEGFFKGSINAYTNVSMYAQTFALFRLDRTDIRYQLAPPEVGYDGEEVSTVVEETIDQTAYSFGYNDAVAQEGFDPYSAGESHQLRRSYARGYSDGRISIS